MAAHRFWNATRHSRTCSINIPLLADWSRKCSSSFLARECGGRKRVIPDCTSARFTLTRKEVTRRKDELFEGAPRSRRVVHPERSEGSRLYATVTDTLSRDHSIFCEVLACPRDDGAC